MAGYSATPLPKKLGIKEGARVALLGAPEGMARLIEPLPPGATVRARLGSGADVIVLFARRLAEVDRRFAAAAKALAPGGGLWVGWPKKASGVATDASEDAIRAIGLAHGLVDNKVCAIDEVWSGLRFMRRR